MFLALVVIGKNVPFIGVSGKNVPYIDSQWEECSLHWWSVGRVFLTLVVSGKNVPCIGGQWEECSLHW
ncbi:unnamed protein product [Staurois parvus]|uniref:Uncharacterized protein n=1 Tax=Staurois parvus TaxID=386267 RepID=A0ABN9B868_9NEOB|nr:unnamed protein product [Staurois parvus]